MDVGESPVEGSCRNGHLRDHLRADQRATAKDPSLEPARRCFARSGVDGLHRRQDSGARVSLGQLRYAGPVARDDADIGVPLSRALFRMGRRRRSEFFTHAAAAVALSDAYIGDPVGAARQRYDLFDADAAGRCSYPAW